jgi:hypothetical protein
MTGGSREVRQELDPSEGARFGAFPTRTWALYGVITPMSAAETPASRSLLTCDRTTRASPSFDVLPPSSSFSSSISHLKPVWGTGVNSFSQSWPCDEQKVAQGVASFTSITTFCRIGRRNLTLVFCIVRLWMSNIQKVARVAISHQRFPVPNLKRFQKSEIHLFSNFRLFCRSLEGPDSFKVLSRLHLTEFNGLDLLPQRWCDPSLLFLKIDLLRISAESACEGKKSNQRTSILSLDLNLISV